MSKKMISGRQTDNKQVILDFKLLNEIPCSKWYPRGQEGIKIISGCQTGVEHGAADYALLNNIPLSGWCPKGRKDADDTIGSRYSLFETDSPNHLTRIEWNIRDSDAVIILIKGKSVTNTSAYTLNLAKEQKKPYWIVNFDKLDIEVFKLIEWMFKLIYIEKSTYVQQTMTILQ